MFTYTMIVLMLSSSAPFQSVPGFKTKQACERAGETIQKDVKGLVPFKFYCVEGMK